MPQRFVAATLLFSLAACSSGGGGGPVNSAPVIVSASFVGAGSTPAANDALLLVFSEAISTGGAIVSDTELVLSGSATLGNVTAAATSPGSNSLSIPLGVGVSFVPGTTTVVLSPFNNIIRDTAGLLGTGGTPVTIGTSDGVAPTISNVTIAAIDSVLNGTGPAGGTLQVPANGWTLDLGYSDNTSIATDQTLITANVPVGTASGTQTPGTNLRPFLTEVSASNTAASYRVPSTVSFPNGPLTLSAIVVDVSGLASTQATFTATVRAFSAALQPFETNVNPSQVWFVDFARDVESFTAVTNGVDVNAGANGVSDFEDLLRILGLTSGAPVVDVNTTVVNRVKDEILAVLAAFYSGANVTFTLTQPAGSFNGNSSVGYASLGYSQISIAGSSTTAGVLGLAIFDPSNTTQNDNTQTNFQSQRLGVFLHTIVDAGFGQPGASSFRLTFDPFTPSKGGTPMGNDALDASRLSGATTDSRKDDIDAAITSLARFAAAVTGHECGHSVGLVENGAMPIGLYGDDSTNFPGSGDGHIRNTALFPSGSTNLMSPSLNFSLATDPASAFNSLNLAYLREQVFYGN